MHRSFAVLRARTRGQWRRALEVIEVPFDEASGAIADAKTIALLYYAMETGLMV